MENPSKPRNKKEATDAIQYFHIVKFPITKPLETKTPGRFNHQVYKVGDEFPIDGQKPEYVNSLIRDGIIKKCVKVPRTGFDLVDADSEQGKKFIESQKTPAPAGAEGNPDPNAPPDDANKGTGGGTGG